jgi:hypothetical protein
MSLDKQAHEAAELSRFAAAQAVKELQTGKRYWQDTMAYAARERHLAYELNDTARIAWAALTELWDERRASSGPITGR